MRDNDRMRKILTLMVVMAGACGSSGGAEMIGGAEADGSAQADGALGTDARVAQDAMALGTDATGGVHDMAPGGDASIGRDAQATSSDMAPAYSQCAPQDPHVTPCGYYTDGFASRVGKWKDGYSIGTCSTSANQPFTGCTLHPAPEVVTDGTGPVLCVSNCDQGCYRVSGAPCASDADCCSPLRCANGKTCQ